MAMLEHHLHQTKNDIEVEARADMVDCLNQLLADCIDLRTQVKQAHWNVKGPHFIGLHELFDKVAADLAAYEDLIAERAVQLGGLAMGTARQAAGASRLAEYPADITAGDAHVDAVSTALATFGGELREAIDRADEVDAVTADMLTEIGAGVDKWLWFVEAHQQDQR